MNQTTTSKLSEVDDDDLARAIANPTINPDDYTANSAEPPRNAARGIDNGDDSNPFKSLSDIPDEALARALSEPY